MSIFILLLCFVMCDNQIKGVGILVFNPTPFWKTKPKLFYLDFLTVFASFVVLALFCFIEMHPQPQVFFLSAIFITSFLSFCGFWSKIRLLSDYRDDKIPVNKRTIKPKTKLVFTRFNENFCSFATLEDKEDDFCNSSLCICADNLPILGVSSKPL